ncbi:MAG: mechanosensitive ion channel [Bacteroidia bacterium]|nr:mechanosensitive ion channel [Bacteroidia bacterium]
MKEFLEYKLIEVGEFSLKVSSVLMLIAFCFAIFLFLFLIRKTIYRMSKIDLAKKYAIYTLIKYFTLVFASVIALQILGINLSVLIAGSAALLVGIGLGLQNLFSDFISGIIILADASIKVNDVIEVNGLVCKVQEINLRTTTVLTRDDKYIILPNTNLTRNQLINWTHNHIPSRFEVKVRVDYSSDVQLVMKILKEAADTHEKVMESPASFVRFSDYEESALSFTLLFWTEEVFRVETIQSQIRIKIYELLKEHKIRIPYPQRVVHLNPS